ncbi:MAG: hypothetical protein H6747_02550 [Deltaproteobacteria bacterium]|nr:hypothetical protein [Deltaproteobacteria bacterium]
MRLATKVVVGGPPARLQAGLAFGSPPLLPPAREIGLQPVPHATAHLLVDCRKKRYVAEMRGTATILFSKRALAGVFALAVLWAAPASARDYERNEVAGRAVGLLIGALPMENAPLGVMAQVGARKQSRWLTLGTQLAIGGHTGGNIALMAGGFAGLESTATDFAFLRGYCEAGVNLFYAGTRLSDTLTFHVEGGIRWLLIAHSRPHLGLHLGLRVMTNFNHLGWAVPVGLHWTFD